MRSRKILMLVVAGLLMTGFVGPVIAPCTDDCESTGIQECKLTEWLQWLRDLFVWLLSRPDGPPPVPNCLLE